jgi:hypothetical protein
VYTIAMTLIRVSTHSRRWPKHQLEALFAEGFPPFITADRGVKPLLGRIREWFTDFDVMVVDDGVPVATAWGVPLTWDGKVATLPGGYTEALAGAVEGHERGTVPNTLVICGAVVAPERAGRGLAGEVLTALSDLATERGLPRVIAPVRPTVKHRYPLTPIAEYATWTRPDGTSFDPWIRTHQRLGATILTPAPASQTMTGNVKEWEGWTGMSFPATGTYVIPDGLSTLAIDHPGDLGTYIEPNVWMRHR